MVNFLTKNSLQTRKLGNFLAKEILKKISSKKTPIFALVGNLGSGKTTFLKGFARGLGIKEKILSPTFIIIKRFKINKKLGHFKNFYHVDCYRIKKSKEILNLGFKEIISNHQNIVAIEWAEKIKKILPKDTIWIFLKFINKNKRKITIKSPFELSIKII